MSKLSSQSKNKLKTLPSELSTQRQEFTFKSQCQDDCIKKLNVASPTFATTELCSSNDGLDYANKENKISLSLKQYRYNENNSMQANMSETQFMKEYCTMIEKCKILQQANKNLSTENSILNEKLNVATLSLLQKYGKKLVTIMQTKSQSSDEEKVNFFLETMTFKESYKELENLVEQYTAQNEELKNKVRELQTIITNYTEKSEKKKAQRQENAQKLVKVEKLYTEKLEYSKQKYSQLEREFEKQRKLAENAKRQYEKLKLLKQEIEKKRKQSLQCNEQLQKQLRQKQANQKTLKQQYAKLQNEYKSASAKLKDFGENSSNVELELLKSRQERREELNKLQLSLSSMEAQNQRYKHNLQNYKLVNQKFSQEITQLRKENQQFYDNVESLKLEKDKLQGVIMKHVSNQERQARRFNELQTKVIEKEKEIQELRVQFELHLSKNTSRMHPQVSKFKSQEEQSEKSITYRASQSETQILVQQKVRAVEQKYNSIIDGLNKEIEQLRKNKENLENQLDSERGRNERINSQLQNLQNTYRKIQEFPCNEHIDRDFKERQMGKYMKSGNSYGGTSIIPFEFTRATKAAPQLKMIKEILAAILNTNDIVNKTSGNIFGIYREKQKYIPFSIQNLIDQIRRMAQQTADYFDQCSKQIQTLSKRIQSKQQVISKLLKFTPEQKKGCILEYLKVKQNDEYSPQKVDKVTKILEDEAAEWKRKKYEEENTHLIKQLMKYKNQSVGLKKYEQAYEKYDKYERFQRDAPERYERYIQYPRRRY